VIGLFLFLFRSLFRCRGGSFRCVIVFNNRHGVAGQETVVVSGDTKGFDPVGANAGNDVAIPPGIVGRAAIATAFPAVERDASTGAASIMDVCLDFAINFWSS